jgi:hypothetical protein
MIMYKIIQCDLVIIYNKYIDGGGDVVFSKKRFILGSLAIFLIGSAFHFLFEALGGSVFAAPFFAVNESVWEHMKLLSTAGIVWMAADYFLAEKSLRPRFFAARAVALPIALLLIPALFYLLKDGFGIESLPVDIGNFLIACIVYETIAMRMEIRHPAIAKWNIAGIALIAGIFALFAVFTFLPPHAPIFQDPPTGGYGIR